MVGIDVLIVLNNPNLLCDVASVSLRIIGDTNVTGLCTSYTPKCTKSALEELKLRCRAQGNKFHRSAFFFMQSYLLNPAYWVFTNFSIVLSRNLLLLQSGVTWFPF